MPSQRWLKAWIYYLFIIITGTKSARPRFDTSTDMGMVLVPADAEVDSVIFRLRATDQDADFPLIFDITATVTPVVRIDNLPCTLYNKVCQANVILIRRLIPGRLHDFAVRVRDSKGDYNSMQATISVTNATTPRDLIFPHIPALIMVPEDAKPGKELDYILVKSNPWSGKPVYIELWQPKELFTIQQRQTPTHTRGMITLIGELDFETQSMYTLTMYATDPYTDPKKDTRNIAGLHLVVIVKDVQDVPPIFTSAPPLTKINNTVQTGDVILRVHAEDGDKGVPREVTYGLVSEGNPFTPFFNISESTGEIILARPLEQLTQITHVGAPVVLSVVAEEIRRSTDEPPAQATVVEVGLLLGEPGNSPPYFENDNYVAWMDENTELGSSVIFNEPYITKVHDEDIGKAGVFALKLDNNNGTFEIGPTVAERTANFILTVRDNTLIDYETYKSLRLKIIAQEVGPATNLSTTVPVTIFLRDINDNPPEFDEKSYQVTLSENITAGTRVIQVHATDKDTGLFGKIQYTKIIGPGNEAFAIDPHTGVITVAMGSSILDREITSQLQLSIEARDENGQGLNGIVPLIINLLDVNDNAPIFEKDTYEFTLNDNLTNFTIPAIIKAFDNDSEPPNNQIRYELVHGNYDNKFILDNTTGELFIREQITKIRNIRHNPYQRFATKYKKIYGYIQEETTEKTFTTIKSIVASTISNNSTFYNDNMNITNKSNDTKFTRRKREEKNILFTLTARAYDLGVPHMSSTTRVNILQSPAAAARIVMFVVPGENPDPIKTAQTLATITGGRITVQDIRPYTSQENVSNNSGNNLPSPESGKRSIVVARVEQSGPGASFVDIEKIRAALAANGVGVINDDMKNDGTIHGVESRSNGGTINNNNSITTVHSEEVTVYRAENKLLTWLLIILGLLMLAALIALIICCICPTCPFYMAPRKRRIHSSETLIAHSDSRTRRNIHRKHPITMNATWSRKKQAWSADPTHNWQFNRRNIKNYGIASLPGDVTRIEIDQEREIPNETHSLRLRDAPIPMFVTEPMRNRRDHDRLFIEDMDPSRIHGYSMTNINQMRQEKFNNPQRREDNQNIRDHHYYREGNAEVMRLVTRGIEETSATMHQPLHHHRNQPEIIIDQASVHRIDGKDILLRRFIEDQKLRINTQECHGSMQELERQSMESHQRQREIAMQQQQQQEILLIPEKLEHRHIEELGPDVQRLIIDHNGYEKSIRSDIKDTSRDLSTKTLLIHEPMMKISDKSPVNDENQLSNGANTQHYSIHDLELARQNVLLTRLLLERDRGGGGANGGNGIVLDTGSYLETQSLPGQVATGTQTNQTISTQTELHQQMQQQNRSRSDNDESEEEAKMRRRLKSKKRYDGEPKRIRTLWMKSPIREDERQYEKRSNLLRKKMKDMKDGRRVSSIEPEVLKEISDSLDETADTPPNIRQRFADNLNSHYETTREEDLIRRDESSSVEMVKRDYVKEHKSRERSRERTKKINEPSFRVLEREMSSLTKKLSKLVGKKVPESEEESSEVGKLLTNDSNEEIKNIQDDSNKKNKKIEIIKAKRSKINQKNVQSSLSKEQTKDGKIDSFSSDKAQKPKINYKKKLSISTGSSEHEDAMEKPKKKLSISKVIDGEKLNMNLLKNIKSNHGQLKRQKALRDEKKIIDRRAPDTSKRKEKISPIKASTKRNKKLITSEDDSDNKEKSKIKSSEHEKSVQDINSDRSSTIINESSPEILNKMKNSSPIKLIKLGKQLAIESPELIEVEVKNEMAKIEELISIPETTVKKIEDEEQIIEKLAESATKILEVPDMILETIETGEKSVEKLVDNEIQKIQADEYTIKINNTEDKTTEKLSELNMQINEKLEMMMDKIKSEENMEEKPIEIITQLTHVPDPLIKKIEDETKIVKSTSELGETLSTEIKDIEKNKIETKLTEQELISSQEKNEMDKILEKEEEITENSPKKSVEKISEEILQSPIVSPKIISTISSPNTSLETNNQFSSLHQIQTPIIDPIIEELSTEMFNSTKDTTKINSGDQKEFPDDKEKIINNNIPEENSATIVIDVSEIPETIDDLSVQKENLQLALETLSITSQNDSHSSTPTHVIISRETSFLNSPRRQSLDETFETSQTKSPEKTEETTSVSQISDTEIKSPNSIKDEKISIIELESPEIIKNETIINEPPLIFTESNGINLDILEDDSDVSSESSTQTAFIAQPYGTPRHRRLVRMEHMDNVSTGDNIGLSSAEQESAPNDDEILQIIPQETLPDNEIILDSDKITETPKQSLDKIVKIFEIIDDMKKSSTQEEYAKKSALNDNETLENTEKSLEKIKDSSEDEIKHETETINPVDQSESSKIEEIKDFNEFFPTETTVSEIKSPDEISDVDVTREEKNEGTTSEKVESINKFDSEQLPAIVDGSSIADQSKEVKELDEGLEQLPNSPEKTLETTKKLLPIKLDSNDESKEHESDSQQFQKHRDLMKVRPKGITSKKASQKKDKNSTVIDKSTDRTLRLREKIKQFNIDERLSEQAIVKKKIEHDKNPPKEKLKDKKLRKEKNILQKQSKMVKTENINEDQKSVVDHSRLSKKRGKKILGKIPKIGGLKKSSSSSEAEKEIDEINSNSDKIIVEKIITHSDIEKNIEETTETLIKKSIELPKLPEALEIEEKSETPENNSKLPETNVDNEIISPTEDKFENERISETKSEETLEKISNTSPEATELDKNLKTDSTKLESPQKITVKHNKDEHIEAQSRYMAWYKHNRDEAERRKRERKSGDDEDKEPPKWLRKSTRQRWLKMSPEDRKIFRVPSPEVTPHLSRRKIQPLINIESEQLKEIVREGRKMRRATGGNYDPPIEIFAPEKPPSLLPSPITGTKFHYRIQHSEYKYEKLPQPFYLHPLPPPVPHSSPQHSHINDPQFPCTPTEEFPSSDDVPGDTDTEIVISMTATNRLRHQQVLEKKSVFDIAYSEAAPSHLRADSTTPPS
ncbi:hypothetical protein PV327_010472 [Microctonus hyperodae]|uniref:Cadherin domain-containing protein n=1 Tax=Microctonus hyperodae TaxID=165561 RepID=A0AA39FSJ1_MICHY|nr:hypothetical protein PV327_010472 [Microctonus hyperodae]